MAAKWKKAQPSSDANPPPQRISRRMADLDRTKTDLGSWKRIVAERCKLRHAGYENSQLQPRCSTAVGSGERLRENFLNDGGLEGRES
jgi:hypothetical protein